MENPKIRVLLDKINGIDTSKTLKQYMSYNSDGFAEYIGLSLPSTKTTDAKWNIRKLTYDGTNITKIEFAQGSNEMAFVWDNRTNYTYS